MSREMQWNVILVMALAAMFGSALALLDAAATGDVLGTIGRWSSAALSGAIVWLADGARAGEVS